MLESVRSRQLWGFLVLTVLPASAGIGYYLRSRKDEYLLESVTPQSVTIKGDNTAKEVREKIELLRKRETRLLLEQKELEEKLQRIRLQESERRGAGESKVV
ncbi:hypothetical protein JCM5350_006105 [Sporobolomyces pararoseus]